MQPTAAMLRTRALANSRGGFCVFEALALLMLSAMMDNWPTARSANAQLESKH
jgi:hypothetical protein